MPPRLRRPWILATVALALAVLFLNRVFTGQPGGESLAYTECPFRGDARVTVSSRVAPEDTLPVRVHEEVHARQCRELGPFRYRFRNLTASGKLSLEAPGYCAGARARLARGMDSALVRERVLDDAIAAFTGLSDSASVHSALRASCPDIAR